MRTLMKVQMEAKAGSEAFQDGTMERTIQDAMRELHPEAAYFAPDEGRRTAYFVFDMSDSSQLPVIAEPMFSKLQAKVEFMPVMNVEDLQAGIKRARR